MLALLGLILLAGYLEWRYARYVALLEAPWHEVPLRLCEISGGEVEKGVQRPFSVYAEADFNGVAYGIPQLAVAGQVSRQALIDRATALRDGEIEPVAYFVEGFPGRVSLVPKEAYSRFKMALPARFMWAIALVYTYFWAVA